MSRRAAFTYLLVAVLLGAAYFSATRWEVKKAERASLEKRVFDVKPADVTTFRIQRKGEPGVVIERPSAGAQAEGVPPGLWAITAPRPLPADQGAVNSALEAFVATERLRALAGNDLDPAEYGLGAPALGVSVGTGDARRGIAFGEENISRDARYARLEGGKEIFLAPSFAFNQMDRGLDLLRDRRLLPLPRSAVRAITLARGDTRVTLRKRDGAWRFADSPRPVSETAVDGLIGVLTETRVEGFVTEEDTDPASHGLDTPDATVTFETDDGPAWLRFAAPAKDAAEGDVLAARSSAPGVVSLLPQFLDRIPRNAAALEDRDLFRADIADARAVTMTGAGASARFVREGDAWRRAEGGGSDGDGEAAPEAPDVEGLLTLLQDSRHEGAPAAERAAEAETQITLRVENAEGTPLLDLEIAEANGDAGASDARLTDADGTRAVSIARFTRETLYDKIRALSPAIVAPPDAAQAGEG
ncbi:MAG: DUF4340 domain-containing protein [Myxococcota bacterium]